MKYPILICMLLLSCSLFGQPKPIIYKASPDVSVDDDFEKVLFPFFKKYKFILYDKADYNKESLSKIGKNFAALSGEKEFKKMDFCKYAYCDNPSGFKFYQCHFKSEKSAKIVESRLLSLNGDMSFDIVKYVFIFIRRKNSIFFVHYSAGYGYESKNEAKILESLKEHLSKSKK